MHLNIIASDNSVRSEIQRIKVVIFFAEKLADRKI